MPTVRLALLMIRPRVLIQWAASKRGYASGHPTTSTKRPSTISPELANATPASQRHRHDVEVGRGRSSTTASHSICSDSPALVMAMRAT